MVFTFCRRQGRANALGESVRALSVNCQDDVLVERKPKELSLLLAGLQLIAGDLYEAASIDGATGIPKILCDNAPACDTDIARCAYLQNTRRATRGAHIET